MRELQELIETTRRARGLSREALADRANQYSEAREITGRSVQFVEVECRRTPSEEILRPIALALGLDWQEVMDAVCPRW